MTIDANPRQDPQTLLGLRPPCELADGPVGRAAASPAPGPAADAPARPSYPVISSGWDSEDEEGRGKTSDVMTAFRALAILSLFILVIALIIR